MANEAKVESIITLFPTEISAVIGTSDAYKTVSNTPGTYDKWYYNKHAVPSNSGGTDIISGTFLGWNQNPPELLSIPVIQDWIFAYPTMAGSRALMIGIALGIVATSFRIIIGLDKSFLGDK